MKNYIIILLLLLTFGIQAQPSAQLCQRMHQQLAKLEQQKLPRNKQLIIQQRRTGYQDMLNDTQQDLNELTSIATDKNKVIDWYKKEVQELISGNEEFIKHLQLSLDLDPKNNNKLIAQKRESLNESIKYLQSKLKNIQDAKQEQNYQRALDKDMKLLQLSDKQLLNYRIQQINQQIENVKKQNEALNNYLNSKDLSTIARNHINDEIDNNRDLIDVYQKKLMQSDDALYKSVIKEISQQIDWLQTSLKQCK